jgi:hypothetical protein
MASGIILSVRNDSGHSMADISSVSTAGATINMVASNNRAEPSKTGLLPSSMIPAVAKAKAISAEGIRLATAIPRTYLRMETLVLEKYMGRAFYFGCRVDTVKLQSRTSL